MSGFLPQLPFVKRKTLATMVAATFSAFYSENFLTKTFFAFLCHVGCFLRVIRNFRAVFRMCVYGIIRYIRRYFKKGKAFAVFSRRLVAMTPLKFLIDEI